MTEIPGVMRSIPESLADELTRQKLVKVRKQTRTRLAKKHDVSEETIRRSMKRVDLYFSTMREYLQRRGGNIWLEVRFPEQAIVVLAALSGNEVDKKSRKKQG